MTEDRAGSTEQAEDEFPLVPELSPLTADGHEPPREVDRCLEILDRPGLRRYGSEVMQTTAMAVADVNAALRQLGTVAEVTALDEFVATLDRFSADEAAGRRHRTAIEWVRRQEAPIGAFLDALEKLVRAVPDLTGRRTPAWEVLATTYRRAHSGAVEMGAFILAGQMRLKEMTEEIAKTDAEDDSDKIAAQLRKRRDGIERRTHLLRIIRRRTSEYLARVREAGTARVALAEELHRLATRALPEWEAVLLSVAEAAQDTSRGRGDIDLAPVTRANDKLREAVQVALQKAAALSIACGMAQATEPGGHDEIEQKIMRPEEGGAA